MINHFQLFLNLLNNYHLEYLLIFNLIFNLIFIIKRNKTIKFIIFHSFTHIMPRNKYFHLKKSNVSYLCNHCINYFTFKCFKYYCFIFHLKYTIFFIINFTFIYFFNWCNTDDVSISPITFPFDSEWIFSLKFSSKKGFLMRSKWKWEEEWG